MTMKRVFLLLITLAAIVANAQTEVNAFTPGANEGVTYSLPETGIEVTFRATCIRRTPGEFSRYAERYLRTKNAIEEADITWRLDAVEARCVGVPSAANRYTIRLGNSKASNIVLNKDGIIESINTRVNRKETPKTAEHATTQERIDASQYMTEEMQQATSSAKMAELVAKEIYMIRESKLAITRGQAENMPSDGAAISLLLQELDKQEKALTELFTGRTDTVYHTYSYQIAPDEVRDTTKAVILRFSQKLGVVEKENLAGEPIYYNIRNLNTVAQPVADETTAKKPEKQAEGVLYNIPGRAKLEIYSRTRRFLDKEIPIAQFGVTEILSKSLFGKSNTVKVLFDTATGGIISINRD